MPDKPPPRPTPFLELASSDPFMSKEEKEKLVKAKRAYDELLAQEGLATYKIELLVGRKWAPSTPSPGALSFWESGSKFHGGGDTIMHICPGGELKSNGCEAFIRDAQHGYGFLVCPECNSVWEGEQVSGQVLARLTATGWTELVLKYFRRLNMDADLRMKYHPDDIRSVTLREQESQRMGEDLERARRRRATRIYPLRNIIKDTSAGADLEGRILAFIRA